MAERVAHDSLLPVIDAGLVDPSEPGQELFPGFSFEARRDTRRINSRSA